MRYLSLMGALTAATIISACTFVAKWTSTKILTLPPGSVIFQIAPDDRIHIMHTPPSSTQDGTYTYQTENGWETAPFPTFDDKIAGLSGAILRVDKENNSHLIWVEKFSAAVKVPYYSFYKDGIWTTTVLEGRGGDARFPDMEIDSLARAHISTITENGALEYLIYESGELIEQYTLEPEGEQTYGYARIEIDDGDNAHFSYRFSGASSGTRYAKFEDGNIIEKFSFDNNAITDELFPEADKYTTRAGDFHVTDTGEVHWSLNLRYNIPFIRLTETALAHFSWDGEEEKLSLIVPPLKSGDGTGFGDVGVNRAYMEIDTAGDPTYVYRISSTFPAYDPTLHYATYSDDTYKWITSKIEFEGETLSDFYSYQIIDDDPVFMSTIFNQVLDIYLVRGDGSIIDTEQSTN